MLSTAFALPVFSKSSTYEPINFTPTQSTTVNFEQIKLKPLNSGQIKPVSIYSDSFKSEPQNSIPIELKPIHFKRKGQARHNQERIEHAAIKIEPIKTTSTNKVKAQSIKPVSAKSNPVQLKQIKSEPVKVNSDEFELLKSSPTVSVITGSKPLEGNVTLDWVTEPQSQRDENILQIQNILFNEKTVLKYPKSQFRETYKDFIKDKDHVKNCKDIAAGKTEDADKNYAGFFLRNGLLVAYGIQYKKYMQQLLYYDAMGNLRYVDYRSKNYPKFPYYALQYGMDGALVGTIYFNSKYDQYVFRPDKSFKGRWYYDKMYNKKGKTVMIRSNY